MRNIEMIKEKNGIMNAYSKGMNKVKKFTAYSDPGHGWIKVPMKLIEKMGLVGKITSYSYLNKGHVFLEEDCDATTFVNRWKELYPNIEILFISKWTNRQSKIRNYQSYNKKS